jgi:hypothetical protein
VEWYPIAVADQEKANRSWTKKESAGLKRIDDGTATAADRKGPPAEPKPIRVFENDADLFLKFGACCKILLAGTIDLESLPCPAVIGRLSRRFPRGLLRQPRLSTLAE